MRNGETAETRRPAVRGLLILAVAAALLTVPLVADAQPSSHLPPGFAEEVVVTGLQNPTAIRFAPPSDGRVFIAEKRGVIKVFDGLDDPTPEVFADLRTDVYNFWDRGLLGLELHPDFPATPYVYALYTYDALPGGTAPRWGQPGANSDPCPTPPGPTGDGCVVTGRLSRFTAPASGTGAHTEHVVMLTDWCQQYPSHSIAGLAFDAEGALYASAGDGASFNFTDYGQEGSPVNPCGDPAPGPFPTPPTAEGGALRSQDVRTLDDPTGLSGSIIRIDPITGEGLSDNPLADSDDPNARRIVGTGVRNPFRLAIHPETDELWFGDVGWSDYEEVNRLADPAGEIDNYGWPCYEGHGRQSAYDSLDLRICEDLYAEGSVVPPVLAYAHGEDLVEGEACLRQGSSISGVAFDFYENGPYPDTYDGALFFADYAKSCIWVMRAGADGMPDPDLVEPFVAPAAGPVELRMHRGELYYLDFDGGTVRRITYLRDPAPTDCPVGELLARYHNNPTLDGAPVLTRCEAPPSHDWGIGSPAVGINADFFSVEWTGRVQLQGGSYAVQARADDGIRVWFDDDLVIDGWREQAPTTYTASVALSGGLHDVRIQYFEAAGGAVADVSWARQGGTADPCPTGQFRAEYHANATLTGLPTMTRCESAIDHDWGTGSPDPSLPADTFSVRWTGQLELGAGAATFTATADDGIRVRLDGDLLIDGWRDQPPTTYTATATVDGGVHEVVVEYYERGGGAVAVLDIDSGNQPPVATITSPTSSTRWAVGETIAFAGSAVDEEDGPLPASALSWNLVLHHCPASCHTHQIQSFEGVASGEVVAPDHEYPSHLELQLVATDSDGQQSVATQRIDPRTVDLTFASVPSGLTVAVGSGSAVTPFTRTVIVGSSNSVSATSPQTLDGQAYEFLRWSHDAPQTHNLTAPATPTTYTATYAPTGGEPAACRTGQLLAEYFANRTLSGEPVLTRCEGPPAHQWADGSPAPGINPDLFSVRWTGNVELEAGTYGFTATADDGIRVLLDGTEVIDGWVDQPATTYTGTATVTGGVHALRIEYYEGAGHATVNVSWARQGAAGCAPGEFVADYFPNTLLTGVPARSTCEPAIAHEWGEGPPGPGLGADHWSARWTRDLDVPSAGTYRFTARADDGIRVLVDGHVVLDGWADQPPTTYTTTVELDAGRHRLVVEYYERGGGAVAHLTWEREQGPTACGPGELTAQYFPNRALAGQPVATRCETVIDHDWGEGAPIDGIAADLFGVRWTGRIDSPGGGDLAITATADDGIRVLVDGAVVVDGWVDQPPTTYTATVPLPAGSHEIVVEYFESYGGAVARASWTLQPPAG